MAILGIVQILIAILFVIILFSIAFFVYNKEMWNALTTKGQQKVIVPIFSGIHDAYPNYGITYNTKDKTVSNYRNIQPSYNQHSGAEFTYNFWLYIDHDGVGVADEDDATYSTDSGIDANDMILVLKGDAAIQNYRNVCGRQKSDILVKCPLIKLSNKADALVVEFNTLSGPEAVREQSRNTCSDQSTDWNYMNAHKLAIHGLRKGPNSVNYNKKWFMVTVVIQDTNPSDPLPMRNKCRCRIFINGTLEMDRYADGSLGSNARDPAVLRQNKSDLHVLLQHDPGSFIYYSERTMMMADLMYMNFAADPAQIKEMYKSGFTKEFAQMISTEDVNNPLNGANVDSISVGSSQQQLRPF